MFNKYDICFVFYFCLWQEYVSGRKEQIQEYHSKNWNSRGEIVSFSKCILSAFPAFMEDDPKRIALQ